MVEIANLNGVNAPQIGARPQVQRNMAFQGANNGISADTLDVSTGKKKSKKWLYWLGGLAAVAAAVYGGGRAGWFGEAFQKRMQELFKKGAKTIEDGVKPKTPETPKAPDVPKTPDVPKSTTPDTPKADVPKSPEVSVTSKVTGSKAEEIDLTKIKVNGQYVFPQTPEDYIRFLDAPVQSQTARTVGTKAEATVTSQVKTAAETASRTQKQVKAQREINAFRLGTDDYYIMENGRVIEKPYDSKEFRDIIKKLKKDGANIIGEAPNGSTVGRVFVAPAKGEARIVETLSTPVKAPKSELPTEAKAALENAKKTEAAAKFQGTTPEAIDAGLGIGRDSANTNYYRALEAEQAAGASTAFKNEHIGRNQYQINDGAKYAEEYARLLDERDAQKAVQVAQKPVASQELIQLVEGLKNRFTGLIQSLIK